MTGGLTTAYAVGDTLQSMVYNDVYFQSPFALNTQIASITNGSPGFYDSYSISSHDGKISYRLSTNTLGK